MKKLRRGSKLIIVIICVEAVVATFVRVAYNLIVGQIKSKIYIQKMNLH